MKFTLQKSVFEKKVILSSHFISTKITGLQALYGTRLLAEENKVKILSTNLNDFYETEITAEVEEKGEVIVETKTVLEFLHFLQDKEITVELKGAVLEISQGKTRGSFKLFKKEEYPEVTEIEGTAIQIPPATAQNLKRVLFSASKDETRPVLTGVYVTHTEENTVFVTTDGFRLSLVKTKKTEELPEMIIPATVLLEIVKISEEEGQEISITKAEKENIVKFVIGENKLHSRILDGEFPPYKKVIPAENIVKVTVNKQELLKKIRLVSVFARENADVVIFHVQEKGVMLYPKGQAGGTEVFVETEEINGESLKIAFNYRYVQEFLNNISADEILMEFSQNTAPGVFRQTEQDGFLHVIMPLRTEETAE